MLTKQCRNLEVPSVRDKTEAVESTKTMNNIKMEDEKKYNMMKINESLISGSNVKQSGNLE